MSDLDERRSRRREARRGAAGGAAPTPAAPKAVRPLVNQLKPFEVLDPDGLDRIHRASMRLLSEQGILIVDYPPARETFRANGAKVEGELVKIDEDTLMHFVRQAPATFTQMARNPLNSVPFGGRNMLFAPIYGPPFVADYDRGRRRATLADFQNFAKLTYMAEHLHHAGGTLCEPNDVDTRERHLDMLLAHLTLNDKAFMGSVTHADNARDTLTMAEIVFGAEALQQQPGVLALVNASSPLRYDDRMFGALEVYARARQAILVTPFLIAGAMSPATMAATLAQQNAEALFGICYAQMLNPGTPCIYGSFLANIDMRSGAPCFGTPEDGLALYAGAQLARP